MLLIKLIGEFWLMRCAKILFLLLYLTNQFLFISSAQLTKACQTANALFEVLKAVNMTQSMEVDREVELFDCSS